MAKDVINKSEIVAKLASHPLEPYSWMLKARSYRVAAELANISLLLITSFANYNTDKN